MDDRRHRHQLFGGIQRLAHRDSVGFDCTLRHWADDGHLYVSNFGDGHVVKVTPAGEVSVFVDVPGGRNAHILWGNGRLSVVGRNVPRIYELDLAGNLVPLAGSGERGTTDGPALEATLGYPNDLALSPDGRRLYFNDVPVGGRAVTPTVVRVVVLPDE